MVTPISLTPQATQQPFPQPAPTPTIRPERTSGALVLNINAPLSNYAGDSTPGGNSAGSAGQSGDSFQQFKSNAPFTPNPLSSPTEQLQQLYANANRERTEAEDARNRYLQRAAELNGQAYVNQNTPQPQPAQSFGQNPFQVNPAQQQAQQFQQRVVPGV